MKDPKEITIESYNKTAEDYAARVEGLFPEEQAESFLSYLPGSSLILDLGCGSGRDAKNFTERGYKVIGIDLSEKLLAIASKNAPKADFRLMDITDLDFSDNYFNGVWAAGSLLHIPKKDIPDVTEGIYRILKPEGILYVSVKEGTGEVIKSDKIYGGVEKFWSFFQEGKLESILETSGFTILESTTDKPDNSYATNPWMSILCRK